MEQEMPPLHKYPNRTLAASWYNNMNKNSKTILFITIAAGILLLTEILFRQFFPKVTFVSGSVNIANKIVGYLAFSFFVFGLLVLLNVNRFITAPVGVILFLFLSVNSCAEVHPVDTTTEPVDIAVMQQDNNGNKLIAREYKNAKTNAVIRDTVLVKDYFIFRQMLENKSSQQAKNR